MFNYNIDKDLTKKYIFEYISQEDIFEYYFEVQVKTKILFCSPLREDKNPTCSFYYKNNILRMRDFGGHFWGDCFDAVAYVINHNYNILEEYNVNFVNTNTNIGFAIILDRIARDFKLHKYKEFKDSKIIINNDNSYTKNVKKLKETDTIIKVKKRNWDINDKNYWFNKYYLNREDLEKFHVYPVQKVFINDKLCYEYNRFNKYDICYAYYFGKINEIKQIKLYYPLRDKSLYPKFINNCNTQIIEGLNLLVYNNNNKYLIHTKSYKDVIILSCVFHLQAIAPKSETNFNYLNLELYNKLHNNFEYQFSLFDYDYNGIKLGNKLKKEYNITPIFLTDKKFNSKGLNGCKDISDYLEKYGYESTKTLIDNYIFDSIEKFEDELEYNYLIQTNLININKWKLLIEK